MTEYWAVCVVYEPFTMGGKVWQERRFAVQGSECDPIDGYEVFHWTNPSGGCNVYEKTTGGLLGTGETLHEAWGTAKKNIRETPDFAEQARALGPAENHPEISLEEAMRRLKKNSKNEDAR